jgi:hypothetical protein
MAIILVLLTLLLAIATYASFVKLAARLYRRTRLSWRSAFGFGALAAVLSLLATLLRSVLPASVVLIPSFALIVAVGGWYLASRATDISSKPLGFKAAATLSAIAVGIAFAIGVALAVVMPAIVPK